MKRCSNKNYITHCFDSIIGQVIEVFQTGIGIKIERVVTTIDCGISVNLDNVKAQCEGCLIISLTATLKDDLLLKTVE